jgi:CheY-like chemotaxis protein
MIPPPDSARPLILVADDNPLNQAVTRGQLQNLGYRVDVVANGEEALEALEHAPYAAVLMDCEMPVMDGYTAAIEIRRREGTNRHTLIVALTAHAMEDEWDRCVRAGMDDYLAKPVKPRELAHMLQRWIPAADQRVDQAIASRPAEGRDAIPATIDADAMEDVRREVGNERLAFFVETVLADLSRLIDRLKDLPQQGSLAAIESDAHRLLGACRTLGFQGIGVVCEQIETSASDGAGHDWVGYAARLDAERKVVLERLG